MINQVIRDRINSLSEEYRKLAIKHKEAIKELTISELPEMVYNSNAIENSTLTLEDTEDILIHNQIRTDHEVREIYEAKNLASAIEYLMDNPEKEISVELILKLHKTLLTNICDEIAGRFRSGKEWVRVGIHIGANPDILLPNFQLRRLPILHKPLSLDLQGLHSVLWLHPGVPLQRS